ncbi:MAG: hypothetical protein LBB74_08950, partial [Chitinispirillales bacterium]|nr:hypothetical protein [Chitinispirillales bacterium]
EPLKIWIGFAEIHTLLRRFAPRNLFISPQGNDGHCKRCEAIQNDVPFLEMPIILSIHKSKLSGDLTFFSPS